MRATMMVGCILLAACGRAPQPVELAAAQPSAEAAPKGDPVEGLRVAKRVGCTGCHMDNGRGGGFDIKTPTGDRLVAPNLTERRSLYDLYRGAFDRNLSLATGTVALDLSGPAAGALSPVAVVHTP